MEKVYLVVTNEVVSYEEIDPPYKAFSDKESAMAYFKQCVEEVRRIADEREWDYEESKTTFSTYLPGYYAEGHITTRFIEVEVI